MVIIASTAANYGLLDLYYTANSVQRFMQGEEVSLWWIAQPRVNIGDALRGVAPTKWSRFWMAISGYFLIHGIDGKGGLFDYYFGAALERAKTSI